MIFQTVYYADMDNEHRLITQFYSTVSKEQMSYLWRYRRKDWLKKYFGIMLQCFLVTTHLLLQILVS